MPETHSSNLRSEIRSKSPLDALPPQALTKDTLTGVTSWIGNNMKRALTQEVGGDHMDPRYESVVRAALNRDTDIPDDLRKATLKQYLAFVGSAEIQPTPSTLETVVAIQQSLRPNFELMANGLRADDQRELRARIVKGVPFANPLHPLLEEIAVRVKENKAKTKPVAHITYERDAEGNYVYKKDAEGNYVYEKDAAGHILPEAKKIKIEIVTFTPEPEKTNPAVGGILAEAKLQEGEVEGYVLSHLPNSSEMGFYFESTEALAKLIHKSGALPQVLARRADVEAACAQSLFEASIREGRNQCYKSKRQMVGYYRELSGHTDADAVMIDFWRSIDAIILKTKAGIKEEIVWRIQKPIDYVAEKAIHEERKRIKENGGNEIPITEAVKVSSADRAASKDALHRVYNQDQDRILAADEEPQTSKHASSVRITTDQDSVLDEAARKGSFKKLREKIFRKKEDPAAVEAAAAARRREILKQGAEEAGVSVSEYPKLLAQKILGQTHS